MSEKNEAIVQNGECSMVEHLERHGVSRREFMTACSVVTATMAVPTFSLGFRRSRHAAIGSRRCGSRRRNHDLEFLRR